MGKRKGNYILRSDPYGNCRVLHPDGTLMFRCAQEKMLVSGGLIAPPWKA